MTFGASPSPTCRGFTYLGVLVMLAVLSMGAALTLEVAETNAQRSAEADLISIGKQYERAFASYYRQSPVNARRYPDKLEDLTRDPRLPGLRRHLRRVYVDPLTGGEWGVVPAPGGGIMAIYSTAQSIPFRESIGPLAMSPPASSASDAASGTATASAAYAQWRFGYDPNNDLNNRATIIRPTPWTPPKPPFTGGPALPINNGPRP